MSSLVEVRNLVKDYPLKTGLIATLTGGVRVAHAVSDIDLDIAPGEIVGVVGESGSGKTTLGKVLVRLEQATGGQVRFDGRPLGGLRGQARKQFHRDVQMIFQDPYDTLNPRLTIFGNVELPLRYLGIGTSGADRRRRVMEALELVELNPPEQFANRYPHQLSGGQRQRVVIARALASDPQVLVADEPVSMLDVSLRAGVLALLQELRRETGVSLLYITHDLLSARVIADQIMVLHHGTVVERGETVRVLRFPEADYTTRLLAAVPQPARRFEAS